MNCPECCETAALSPDRRPRRRSACAAQAGDPSRQSNKDIQDTRANRNYCLFPRCRRSLSRGIIRSLPPFRSITTVTRTEDSSLKGNPLSSTTLFGRYRKYFPSFRMEILPLPCRTTCDDPPHVSSGGRIVSSFHLRNMIGAKVVTGNYTRDSYFTTG